MLNNLIKWVLGLTALFLILYYYAASKEVIQATSESVGGTITRLQKGV